MELYITLTIILIAIFLFVKDYFTIDTTSILIMAMFIVTGVLDYEEGFSGFNHPATITLGCMFVVSAAVFKTGIIDGLSTYIIQLAKIHYVMALVVFCVISATFSAFVNDAAVVAILIPMALLVCRESGISPSRLLIPISFSSLFGGTCTLIGTSTNILVSSYAEKSGYGGFGMFEFSMPALCLLAIGMSYIFIFGPLILPKRSVEDANMSKEAERYVVELTAINKGRDIGKPVRKSHLSKNTGAQVLSILRDNEVIGQNIGETVIKQGDVMKVMISPKNLQNIKNAPDYALTDRGESLQLEDTLETDRKMYEVMLPAGSQLAGYSLRKLNFRNVYKTQVLGIRQREALIMQEIADVALKEGDMLLIQADQTAIEKLTTEKQVVVLSEFEPKKVDYKRAIPALLIAAGVVASAATGLTSILMSGMIGCLIIVTTGILKAKEAYQAIEWKVIFMMAGVLSMGKALEKTGGSDLISSFIFNTMGDLNPRITLSLIFLISFLATNVLSSKATAALLAPIVISLSAALGVSEKPFLIAVMFACSLTFMTPVSYPVNTMVYAPGNYKFNDFVKFGTPLNILIWIAASFIIPWFFPF